MEVAPDLYRLEIPSPNHISGPVNTYLIAEGEALILIDAGYGGKAAFQAFTDQLDLLKFHVQQIKRIFITHLHPDHYGMVSRIRDVSGASVEFHRAEAELFGHGGQIDTVGILAWLRSHGVPENMLVAPPAPPLPDMVMGTPFQPDRFVLDGEEIRRGAYRFEAIITPGHSPGHICLYDRTHQLLISGDHVLPQETPNIGLHFGTAGNPLKQYLTALDRVTALPVTQVLPGHGKPFADLKARASEMHAHHDQRLDIMLNIIAEGTKTAYDVAANVPWGLHSLTWDNFPPFQKYFALAETLAHLEYLVDAGSIGRSEEAGLIRYTREP